MPDEHAGSERGYKGKGMVDNEMAAEWTQKTGCKTVRLSLSDSLSGFVLHLAGCFAKGVSHG